MALAAANFRFQFDGAAFFGYFSTAGLQCLELRPDGEAPPILLHSSPNSVWGHDLYRLLEDYFAGMAVSFEPIPLDLRAGSLFQQAVWQAALTVPYGATTTYGALARQLGNPGAARAVGAALGANPVCLVVPCHRVIAAGGAPGGYAHGLYWKKRFLLLESGRQR